MPFTVGNALFHRKLRLQTISLVELSNTAVKTDKYHE